MTMLVCTVYLLRALFFSRVLICVMRVDPRARAQKFFFNASQARQLSFNICLAVCTNTDFSTISCSSLGGACVATVDDLLLSRDF